MNKTGGNNIINVYWFIILTIVAASMVLMVNSFYNNPYDVRELEGEILATKVADCIYFGGKMNPNLISEEDLFKEDFKEKVGEYCNLNFDSQKDYDSSQYYVYANFSLLGNSRSPNFEFSFGNSNYLSDCNLDQNEKNIAKCTKKKLWVRSPKGNSYLVEIISIVAKVKQNVK